LIYVLAPIVVALLGVAGVAGVAQSDIRDRYQVAADIILWSAVGILLLAMVAAIYPIALERQLRNAYRFAARRLRAFFDHRHFHEWVEQWSAYSMLVHRLSQSTDDNRITVGDWRDAQPQYDDLRSWFMANARLLPPDVADFVRDHVAAQWPRLTETERGLGRGGRGFFSFYSQLEFDLQMIRFVIDARDVRQITHTLAGVWDGLSAYSVQRGWGPRRNRGWRDPEAEEALAADPGAVSTSA
jgi:hypothetical protein